MKRLFLVGALTTLASAAILAQSGGTIVAGGPGTQTDPHVSGDWVAYTNVDTAEIHFLNLLSAESDAVVPRLATAYDGLPDISNDTIVFNRNSVGDKRVMFTIVTNGVAAEPQELSPLSAEVTPLRQRAVIGGTTVAYEEIHAADSTSQPEISISDTSNPSAPAIRLTNDTFADRYPAVSPAGDVVAFVKSTATGSDIYLSRLVGGAWTAPVVISGPGGNESFPDTNGSIVVYGSDRNAENDIYYYTVGTGKETQISIPGLQQNPNVSGNYIAFESDPDSTGYNDIYIYDLQRNMAFAVTNTPAVSERLNDIFAGPDGWIRVVWASPTDATAGLDIYAARFQLAAPPCEETEGPVQTPIEVCESPGQRPLLADVTATRATADPTEVQAGFGATAGDEGVVCLDNTGTTAGWVNLNGATVLNPSAFKRQVAQIARQVELQSSNTLAATIASDPGTSYRVRVYGPTPTCAQQAQKPVLNMIGPNGGVARTIEGVAFTVGDGIRVSPYEPSNVQQ